MRGEEARVREDFCGGEGEEEDGEGGGAERVGGCCWRWGVRRKGVRGCGECGRGCGCVVLACWCRWICNDPLELCSD